MATVKKALSRRAESLEMNEPLEHYISKGASVNSMTWRILGGKEFMPKAPASSYDLVLASSKGISKQAVLNLADVMDIPMKDMAGLLNLSYKTLGRKRRTDLLDSLVSSLSIEIAGTIANGLSVFEDSNKLKRWLQKENRALSGRKPIELLNTPTGINMVNRVLGRIEEGVYT
jgi:putative toxin-antitoxin system antitoxin component (TIGR02293 family)